MKRKGHEDEDDRTDEELAQLVADKVADHPKFTGALSQMRPDQPFETHVDPELKAEREADIVHPNDDVKATRLSVSSDKELAADIEKANKKQKLTVTQPTDEDIAAETEATKFKEDFKNKRKVLDGLSDADLAKLVKERADQKDGGKTGGTKASLIGRAMAAIGLNAAPESGRPGNANQDLAAEQTRTRAAQGAGGGAGGGPGNGMSGNIRDPLSQDNGSDMPARRGSDVGSVQHVDANASGAGFGGGSGTSGSPGAGVLPPIRPTGPTSSQERAELQANPNNPYGMFDESRGKSIGTVVGEQMGPMDNPAPAPDAAPIPTTPASPNVAPAQSPFQSGAAQKTIQPPADVGNTNADLSAAAQRFNTANDLAAESLERKGKATAKVLEDEENQRSLNQAYAQNKMEFVQKGQNDMMKNIVDAQAVLNNPAKTPDPERYWKNHSKVMFAIGVGLLAQAGKDINGVLQNASAAIDRDIEEQKQQYEAPRTAARSKQAASQTMYGMFRDMGHDAFEAERMASAVLHDRAATEVAKIAANSDSETAKANAQMAQAQLGMTVAEKQQAALQHKATNDTAMFGKEVEQEHGKAQISAENAKTREAAKGRTEKGAELASSEARKLADAVTGVQELAGAGKVFDSNAFYNKISSLWPTGTTEAGAFDRARPEYTRILMGLLSPAERQNETMVKNVERMVPNAGDLDGKVRWNKVVDFVTKRVGAEADALKGKNKGGQVDRITGSSRPGQKQLPSGEWVNVR